MERSPFWAADSCSAGQETTCLYGTRKFIAMLTRPRSWTVHESTESNPHLHIPFLLETILILSSHLKICPPTGLLLSGSPTKRTVRIYHLENWCYMSRPSHLPWFDQPNKICSRKQVTKFFIMYFSAYAPPVPVDRFPLTKRTLGTLHHTKHYRPRL